MPRRKPPNQMLRLLKGLADVSVSDGYHHLLLTLGGRDTIAIPQRSTISLDGLQLAQRFGFNVQTKDDVPELTIYDKDALSRLTHLTKKEQGKQEVDCALMVRNERNRRGEIDIAGGTRRLKVDDLVDRLGRRIETGSARVALAAISLIDGVYGYFVNDDGFLFEYCQGRKRRVYNPRTQRVTHFMYGPDGTLMDEAYFDIKTYDYTFG